MPYYTEEQRKRGLETRRRNLVRKKYLEGRIDVQDYTRSNLASFGVSMPKVPRPPIKPSPAAYGLPEGIEEEIKRLDKEAAIEREKTINRLRSERQNTFLLVTSFLIIPTVWLLTAWMASYSDWPSAISNICAFGFFPAIGWIIWGFSSPTPPAVKLSGMRQSYENYRNELRDWEYWENRRLRSYWNRMDGAKFEREIANLFRLVGFHAELTKASGDGGVDIILTHGSRKIAVQCKRYSKDVGPHVIRDLWGTMHHLGYTEGCIVTSAYFTPGVIDFAKDKNIVLINMSDILQIVGDNGIGYLKNKMHLS